MSPSNPDYREHVSCTVGCLWWFIPLLVLIAVIWWVTR